MSGGRHGTRRLGATLLLVAACTVALAALVWTAANWNGLRTRPQLGWLPLLASTTLGGYACWRAGGLRGLPSRVRSLWRRLAIACGIATAAAANHAYDAIHRSVPSIQPSMSTCALYLAATLTVLTALLGLSSLRGKPERRFRFLLDASAIGITVGVFAWYYAVRFLPSWHQAPSTVVTFVLLVLVGLLGASAVVKLSLSGDGEVDAGTVRRVALAPLFAAGGGLLSTALAPGVTHIGRAQYCVPIGMAMIVFAADRQRRVGPGGTPAGSARPFSVLPYAAVAATDGLLLFVAAKGGTVPLVVSVAAVALTGVVALRQVRALRDNGRLLADIDASLAELHHYQAELTHRANHDQLTDLANRTLFEQECRRLLAAGPPGEGLSVALIDLDDFKGINDRLGHTAGDTLLVAVAQRLRDCLRPGDVVARLGGDEFGLLLPGVRGDAATAMLDRIGQALSSPVRVSGRDLLVQASMGLADAWPGSGPQELIRRADVAMYAAKERGKGQHAVYDAQLEQSRAADAQLAAELRQALDRGEFWLVYQPIVRLPDGAWTGVEALVRWRHPERGMVPPDVFVPVAERTGLIVALGDWILRTASGQAARWLERFGPAAPDEVGVNVSARQLREPGFAADVAAALADTGLSPHRLKLEVTETAVFSGGVALDTLRAAAALGVRVALDDFGTGHSSLGLLRTCPADTLKVDKSFVDGICGPTQEAVIATAMIQITDGLRLQAVAEGVETAEQAQTLHRLGYRFAQGYHFAKPMSAAEVEQHLVARSGRPTVTV